MSKHLKEGGVKKNKGRKEVCIAKDTMVVAQSNELKFQRLFKHHPF
jgi:hypothetical protein